MATTRKAYVLPGVCLILCLHLGCGKSHHATFAANASTQVERNNPPASAPFEGASGRNTVLQMPFDNAAKLVMLNIGRSYQMAVVANGKPPRNAEEAGLESRNLKTKRDMQDREVEVVYGVDVKKLGDDASSYALAWEKTPDNNNGRMVLMADYVTVKYVSTAEFEAMKKAR